MQKRAKCIAGMVCILLLAGLGCAKTSGECPIDCGPNLKCCGGLCVDVQNNKEHCGYCGNGCPEGTTCRLGECVEACGEEGMICSSTQSCCDGECTDTRSNTNHCGGCGNQCEPGQVCTAGTCETLTCDPPCESGETCCRVGSSNSCVDISTDHNHCGTCGNDCGPNEVCRDGVCSADLCEPPCAEGLKCCGGVCVDSQNDPNNCGFCGKTCDEETSDGCTAGQCSCRGALECRSGQKCCADIGCRNIMTDPSNCGDCGHQCNIGESCVEGECMCGGMAGCAETESCCSGTCLETATDPNNCGGCGLICDESGPDCVAGQCMCGTSPACAYGRPNPMVDMMLCMSEDHSAYQKCCGGMCVEMSELHCGSCDVACEDYQICEGMYFMQCVFSCTGDPPYDPTPDYGPEPEPDTGPEPEPDADPDAGTD